MYCSSYSSQESIISTNYFENAAHDVSDSDRGKRQHHHFWGCDLASLKADEAVIPRVDFVITKSNLILSSVLFSARLLRLTLAACRSHTDG